MMIIFILSGVVALVCSSHAGPATESYKDQFCTDPRTMQKHKAYTEWADAYSCTRHRCQPGGRNLAIYTVGCRRVEAPESAIECEEVVEDTNMQFPYCCTRLRCLVVVRGEVWTRVLGQPWETLPAAPWSHMYKMKKPPPGDSSFLPKVSNEGPIYELTSDVEGDREKVLRASKKTSTESPDCNEVVPRSVPTPDIVIALSTGNEPKESRERAKSEQSRYKRGRKQSSNQYYDEDVPEHRNELDNEDLMITEKPVDPASEEKFYANSYGVTQKPLKHHQVAWTEVPAGQWSEHETDDNHGDPETVVRDGSHQPEFPPIDDKPQPSKEEKPTNLQALVDAIGTRMRDIENVVQRMSEKVHQPDRDGSISDEKRPLSDTEGHEGRNRHLKESREHGKNRMKRPNPDDEHYKRFSVRNRGSKYLHTTDSTTEQPLFVEDSNMNGYFSDASNSVVRRANGPKLKDEYNSTSHERIAPEVLEEHAEETRHHAHHCNHSEHHRPLLEPLATYMAPVENRRKSTHILTSDSEEAEKKKKKHSHRRKKGKGKSHRKHHRDEKKKRTNKNSVELDRNVVSLEDSSAKK